MTKRSEVDNVHQALENIYGAFEDVRTILDSVTGLWSENGGPYFIGRENPLKFPIPDDVEDLEIRVNTKNDLFEFLATQNDADMSIASTLTRLKAAYKHWQEEWAAFDNAVSPYLMSNESLYQDNPLYKKLAKSTKAVSRAMNSLGENLTQIDENDLLTNTRNELSDYISNIKQSRDALINRINALDTNYQESEKNKSDTYTKYFNEQTQRLEGLEKVTEKVGKTIDSLRIIFVHDPSTYKRINAIHMELENLLEVKGDEINKLIAEEKQDYELLASLDKDDYEEEREALETRLSTLKSNEPLLNDDNTNPALFSYSSHGGAGALSLSEVLREHLPKRARFYTQQLDNTYRLSQHTPKP